MIYFEVAEGSRVVQSIENRFIAIENIIISCEHSRWNKQNRKNIGWWSYRSPIQYIAVGFSGYYWWSWWKLENTYNIIRETSIKIQSNPEANLGQTSRGVYLCAYGELINWIFSAIVPTWQGYWHLLMRQSI